VDERFSTGQAWWDMEADSRTTADPGPAQRADDPAPRQVSAATRRDVVATFIVFAANGAVAGTWFSRVPAVRDHLHADLRTVGFVLLCFGLGSLVSMPFTGRLILRFSTRSVCVVGSSAACVALPTLGLIDHVVAFGALLFVAGAAYGMWDVTLNVHGAAVEQAFGRVIMPQLHGAWSGGMILGSAGGAVLAGAGLGLAPHFLVAMPILLVVNLVAIRTWRDRHTTDPEQADSEHDPAPSRGRVLTGPVLALGVMALCCALSEGAASDWLALHAHDDRGMSPGLAATVYTAYAVTVTIGRLSGGWVIGRFGRLATLRASGVVAALGVATAIVVPGVAGIYAGALLWGLGLSVVFPAVVSAAGELGGADAPRTIAAVSTIAWGAYLVGPPAIGLLAQQSSIGRALWLIVALALGITVLATSARPRSGA